MTSIEEREREKELQGLSVIGPDGVDGFGQHHYKLGHFVIIYYHGEIDWEYCLEEPGVELSQVGGEAWVKNCDLLVMSPWKARVKSEWESLDEYNKWRDSLPIWDKTPYFIKMADIGNSGFRDCRTGELVPDEVAESIMLKSRIY